MKKSGLLALAISELRLHLSEDISQIVSQYRILLIKKVLEFHSN